MKKLLGIVVLSLTFAFTNLYAEMKSVSISVAGDEFFVDMDTKKKLSDGTTIVWTMANYKKPLSSGSKSSMQRLKINCEMTNFIFIEYVTYTKLNGYGEPSYSKDLGTKYHSAPPGTPWHDIMKYICS